MPLTDPELDLLREMLEEDPADEAFLQVGEELVRRARWAEAEEILSRGVAHHPGTRGFELLARAALETGRYDLATTALDRIDRDPRRAAENARVEILVLERAGRVDDARARAGAFLAVDPNDVVVRSVVERLDAPPPAEDQRGHDPFHTVARAERYVAIGRPDRAVRVYRRILLAHPGDAGLLQRARQLAAAPVDAAEDDLSEELTDPGMVPPEPSLVTTEAPPLPPPRTIDMPVPSLTPAPAQRREDLPPFADAAHDPDEEDTDLTAGKLTGGPVADDEAERRQRRRRRSLIRK